VISFETRMIKRKKLQGGVVRKVWFILLGSEGSQAVNAWPSYECGLGRTQKKAKCLKFSVLCSG
jgi:hypothetical protein